MFILSGNNPPKKVVKGYPLILGIDPVGSLLQRQRLPAQQGHCKHQAAATLAPTNRGGT